MASLEAHNINIYREDTFFGIDIPFEKALECKKAVFFTDGTSQAGGYQCYQKYYGIFSYKRQKARKTTECKMG